MTEFKTIGDRAQLSLPADSPVDSPTQLPYTPYLYAEVPNTNNLKGFLVQVAQDRISPRFLTRWIQRVAAARHTLMFSSLFTLRRRHYLDKTLYWRYTIKHTELYPDGGRISFSPPSEPHAFTKSGLIPANLQISGTYGSPTFIWNPVEGAAQYNLQVSNNPLFSPVVWERTVNHETFTREDPFASGRYYWRVRSVNNFNASLQ